MEKILHALQFEVIAIVNKTRLIYMYQDKYEISLDYVKELGYFIEIEVKKYDKDILYEYDDLLKLARSFEFEAENKRLNTDTIERLSQENDELQELLDSQSNREAEKERMRKKLKQLNQEKVMPWDAGKQREMKQRLTDELSRIAEIDEKAANGYQRIHENEKRVLELSKEDTLLGYEKQSIIAKFGSFENFKEKNAALYRDYITDLIATGNRRN